MLVCLGFFFARVIAVEKKMNKLDKNHEDD